MTSPHCAAHSPTRSSSPQRPSSTHARVLVTGAGIDGELPETLVLERYEQLDAQLVHRLTAEDVEPFRPLFDWHPSEATGLLCAAAAGTRGTAEIRDQGFPVVLSDHTPDVHAPARSRASSSVNRIAQLRGTTHRSTKSRPPSARPAETPRSTTSAAKPSNHATPSPSHRAAASTRERSPTSSPRSEATPPDAASTTSPCAASPNASGSPEQGLG